MPDSIQLLVGNRRIENFLGWSVDADLYTTDHAFSLDLVNPETTVTAGKQCQLSVNGTIELTGIIDRVTRSYDKSGARLRVEGRDLMGLLVDSYCEEFFTVQDMDLKTLAGRLLANVPFINRKQIVYQENITGNLKKKKGGGQSMEAALGEEPLTFAQIEPGQTIFEVLKEYSRSRGLMFWGEPDGTLVFGRPLAGGAPGFGLITRKADGSQNNVIEAEEVLDISRRYSSVTVVGQQQGMDSFGMDDSGAERINTLATETDDDFPFHKPYVATNNNDSRSPALEARMILEQQRHDGRRLTYKVAGMQQTGKNWTINNICSVDDEVLGIREDLLIYGRTFEMTKQGVFTTLRLGPPGMIQS